MRDHCFKSSLEFFVRPLMSKRSADQQITRENVEDLEIQGQNASNVRAEVTKEELSKRKYVDSFNRKNIPIGYECIDLLYDFKNIIFIINLII